MLRDSHYGPWATSIDTGSRPQLSAFWRRRLTMLVPTSQTSPALSRRNRLWLAAATILVFAVPTLRPVFAADKPQEKPGQTFSGTLKVGQKPAGKAASAKRADAAGATCTGTYVGDGNAAGTWTTNSSNLTLPYPLSAALSTDKTRAELHLTRDQENKLREASNDYSKRLMAVNAPFEKKGLSDKQRVELWKEIQPKQAKLEKEIRKQVEAALTAEQLDEVKSLGLGSHVATQLTADEKLQKEVGITDEQLKQLQQLNETSQQNRKQMEQASIATNQSILAVVTPQQWEQYGPTVPTALLDRNMNVSLLASYAAGNGQFGPRWKELALSAEQVTKVKNASTKLQARYGEMSKLGQAIRAAKSKEEAKLKQAELERIHKDAYREWQDASLAVLTPPQQEILNNLTLRCIFVNQTYMLDSREGNAKALGGLFEHFKLSDDQLNEMRRLRQDLNKIQMQITREEGHTLLQILSPQQQEKYLDTCGRGGNYCVCFGPTLNLGI